MLPIGFEQARYEFRETNESHEAVIIKENGTITEQTYLIDVYASDGSALNGLDYIIGEGATQRVTILPDQQSLPFLFEILLDNIFEQDEIFTISLENAPKVQLQFKTQGTITTTIISISDRTRKITTSNIIHV